MRNLDQPLSDYDRLQIVAQQVERQSRQWAQSAVANEGGGLVVSPYSPNGFWAGITGVGQNAGSYISGSALSDNRMQYEWVELIRQESKDKYGNTILSWIPLDGTTQRPDGGAAFDRIHRSYTSAHGVILCPAVETSGNQTVPIGSVVWMMPGGRLDFPMTEDFTQYDRQSLPTANVEYLFSWGESVRSFVVAENHIPAAMVGTTGALTKNCPRFVVGYFADDLTQTLEKFYPASSPISAQNQAMWERDHPGVPAPISVASDPVPFGPVVCEGQYNAGRGWAKWITNAYDMPQEGTNPRTWKGQWQIISMNDSLILDGEVHSSETSGIAPGKSGSVKLWWPQNFPDGPLVDSGYVVAVCNILETTLSVGQKFKIYWDRDDYAWYPLIPSVETRLKCYNMAAEPAPMYGVMAVTECDPVASGTEKCIKVDKPSSTYYEQYVVNDQEIAARTYGRCYDTGYVLALYDASSGTPAVNDVWAPKAGQWTLTQVTGHSTLAYPGWHVVVAGIYDADNHILIGRIVPSQCVSMKFYDNSGEEVPAYSVMAVTECLNNTTSKEKCVKIQKPSATYYNQYMVNGPIAVPTQYENRGFDTGLVLAAYDTGTPAVNEIWCPKAGQWTLAKNTTVTAYGWHVVVAGVYDSTNKILIGRIVPGPVLVPIILHDNIGPGDEDKEAYLQKGDGTAESVHTLKVSDLILKNSRGKGAGSFSGYDTTKAARGVAVQGANGKMQILSLNGQAMRCQCLLAAALASTDASVSVDNVVPIDGGFSPVASSSSTLTAYNRRNTSNRGGYEGVDNETCWIEWDEYNDKWWIYDMACKA